MSKIEFDAAPNLDEKFVAEYFGVSIPAVRGWRRKKIGPAYTRPAGHLVRYTARDIAAWAASQRASA